MLKGLHEFENLSGNQSQMNSEFDSPFKTENGQQIVAAAIILKYCKEVVIIKLWFQNCKIWTKKFKVKFNWVHTLHLLHFQGLLNGYE